MPRRLLVCRVLRIRVKFQVLTWNRISNASSLCCRESFSQLLRLIGIEIICDLLSVVQLLAAHQQELDEIMEKIDVEKQRQQANLHQKLLERKKRRQEAQQRKQEREMAKELLEQKKELAEVRTQRVSN